MKNLNKTVKNILEQGIYLIVVSITKCSVGVIILAIMFNHQKTYSQQEVFDDHLFPAQGTSQLMIGTGVPYLVSLRKHT